MADMGEQKLVIAISSRALFNLDDAHHIFQTEGLEAYSNYQIKKEDDILEPGQAFPMVKKLLALNQQLTEPLGIEVILLSRNSADTGLRVFNSIEHYGLGITRAAFCGGEPPWRYIEAFGCQLFLSAESEDVRVALANGVAAATLVSNAAGDLGDQQLRIAFDGDAVVFQMKQSGFIKKRGLTPLRPANRPPACSRSWAALLSSSCLPCSACSRHCPERTPLCERHWSRPVQPPRTNALSELCVPGIFASMNLFFSVA